MPDQEAAIRANLHDAPSPPLVFSHEKATGWCTGTLE